MYVILYPNSNTNPTDQYRVVHDREWMRYANGATPMLAIASSHTTYDDAEKARDRLNHETG